MTGTQSFIDLLSTNLAYIFHRYLFVKNKQTCSHKLSSNQNVLATNSVKKVRINMNKYGHLFNPVFTKEINNKIQLNDNKMRKKKNMHKNDNQRRNKNTKIKSKKVSRARENERQPPKTIIMSPSISNSSNEIKIQLPEDPTLKIDGHQLSKTSRESSSTPLTISETRILEEETDSILHLSDQYRDKMKFLYHMNPIVNKNYINTRNLSNEIDVINTFQHKKMKQYSKGLKPEQLFRCPKDSRSKRRKCCGVYYELFEDAWRLLEGWFTIE